jgi:hemerythrin
MAVMTWSSTLSGPAPSIDARHVVLVETLNELHNALMQGDARKLVGPLLQSLLSYTRSAFLAEEAALRAGDFPGLAKQQELHQQLKQQLEGFVVLYDRGELTPSLPLLHFLRDWFSNHLQKADRSCRPWLT